GGHCPNDPPRHRLSPLPIARADRVRPGAERLSLCGTVVPPPVPATDPGGADRAVPGRAAAAPVGGDAVRGELKAGDRQTGHDAPGRGVGPPRRDGGPAGRTASDPTALRPGGVLCPLDGGRLPATGGDGLLDGRSERDGPACVRPLRPSRDRRWLVRRRLLP